MRSVSELLSLKIVHHTKKVSLCLHLPAVFQHNVRPAGQGVKVDLNKKNLFKQLLVPNLQLNLNGYFDT